MGTQLECKYSAFDIAKYFLYKAQSETEEDHELISNLKLQKLVYYAQGIHLALYNKPLFSQRIEAWQYGPIVPDLYHYYKDNGSDGITADKKFKISCIDKKTRAFLDEVYDVFGQFSAVQLMKYAHSDRCWIEAGIKNEISWDAMSSDLKKYLTDG